MKLRIYVAGPYCPRDCSSHDAARIAQQNVDRAIAIGNALIDKGHYAFVPHLSHYLHLASKVDRGVWYYEYDNTFLTHWAEALFYIDSSYGADCERALAHRLGLPIYYSLDEVP